MRRPALTLTLLLVAVPGVAQEVDIDCDERIDSSSLKISTELAKKWDKMNDGL